MRFPNFAGPDRFLMQPRGFHGECHGVSCAHCFALTGWEGWEFGGFARIFHEETVVQVGKIFASSIYSYRAKFTSCQIKTPARGCIILKGSSAHRALLPYSHISRQQKSKISQVGRVSCTWGVEPLGPGSMRDHTVFQVVGATTTYTSEHLKLEFKMHPYIKPICK